VTEHSSTAATLPGTGRPPLHARAPRPGPEHRARRPGNDGGLNRSTHHLGAVLPDYAAEQSATGSVPPGRWRGCPAQPIYGEPMPAHDEGVRLYGPWRVRTPADVADLFEEYRGPWWVAGGWAVEAFTGIHRQHGDLDPSIPRADVALLQNYVAGRLDVWAADNGTLRPLVEPVDKPLAAAWTASRGVV